MNALTKRYFISFFYFAIIYGLIMLLIQLLLDKIDWLSIVIISVFFGGFMSWGLVATHKKALQNLKKEPLTDDDFAVKRTEYLANSISIEKALQLLSTNELTKSWNLKVKDSTIFGKTKRSKGSWGERIQIVFYDGNISITSKPLLFTTLFDNGKNIDNVNVVKAIIQTN
jgi:hypothetical protein